MASQSSITNERATPRVIALTLLAYRALLRLCPRELREAYGAQMLQVTRQLCRDAYAARGGWGVARLWAPALGDLVAGACAEYLALLTHIWKESWRMNRLRSSAITVFCGYILFVAAGIGYQKLTEDIIHAGVQDANPPLAVAFIAVEVGAGIALLAVLAGGLPLAFAALRYALVARRWDIPLLFAVPVLAFAALIGYLAMATRFADTRASGAAPTPRDHLLAYGLIAVFALGAVASVAAVALAIARAPLDARLLRFTRLPALVTTVAMAVMLVAVVVWGLSLRAVAPQFFNGNDGALATSTLLSWLAVVAEMAIATLVALVGLARGSTPRQLAPATT